MKIPYYTKWRDAKRREHLHKIIGFLNLFSEVRFLWLRDDIVGDDYPSVIVDAHPREIPWGIAAALMGRAPDSAQDEAAVWMELNPGSCIPIGYEHMIPHIQAYINLRS